MLMTSVSILVCAQSHVNAGLKILPATVGVFQRMASKNLTGDWDEDEDTISVAIGAPSIAAPC